MGKAKKSKLKTRSKKGSGGGGGAKEEVKVLSKKRKTTFNTSGKKKGTKRQATRSHGGSSKTEECQASEGGEPVFAGKRKVSDEDNADSDVDTTSLCCRHQKEKQEKAKFKREYKENKKEVKEVAEKIKETKAKLSKWQVELAELKKQEKELKKKEAEFNERMRIMNTGYWEGTYVDLLEDEIPNKSKIRAVACTSEDESAGPTASNNDPAASNTEPKASPSAETDANSSGILRTYGSGQQLRLANSGGSLALKSPAIQISEEEKRKEMFIDKYKDEIRIFGIQDCDCSGNYLRAHPHLVRKETADFLRSWCANLVLQEKPAMMRIVAHQTVSLYQILEMASLSDRDPISCVSGFYSVMKSAEEYREMFSNMLRNFIKKTQKLAKNVIDHTTKMMEGAGSHGNASFSLSKSDILITVKD